MHSSHPNSVFVRSSNPPLGSREHPRGHSDYSTWRNRQREQEYEAASYSTSSAMDAEYHPAPAPPANPVYGGQPYPAAPPASYPPATYPPPAHASSTQYPAQAPYGYPSNPPPPTQYSPQPQASGDRYSAMAPPPPMPGTYRQDAFVHGSNYQTSAPYATANPARMPPAVPLASAAPSRTYNAPVAPAGTPIYGTETDPYGYPPAGNPAAGFPTDALYGRGAYTTTTANQPKASSDDLGSPAGATARPGFAAPPDPKYDDLQSPPLQPATTSANPAPAQMTSSGAPAPRHDRDREREPEPNERDYRDHRVPRGPGRDERHPDGNGPRQRHR